MARRIIIGLLWGIVAYFVGAIGGGFLVYLLSSNQHDREMEAGMTGAFFLGPLAAFIGFAIGVWRAKPKATAEKSAS